MYKCIIEEETKDITFNGSHYTLIKDAVYPDFIGELSPLFFQKIEAKVETKVEIKKRGRPKKEESEQFELLLDSSSDVTIEID